MDEKTTVYLIPSEVTQFLLFQQYYQPFSLLVDRQVFEQKNATVLLDFDHLGVLQTIRRNDSLYSRKHDGG